jgi:hypothetical protein
MDAEFSGFVRSGGHHTAPVIRQTANNDGLAFEGRVVELFHRGVKSVNVRMDKAGHGYQYKLKSVEGQAINWQGFRGWKFFL